MWRQNSEINWAEYIGKRDYRQKFGESEKSLLDLDDVSPSLMLRSIISVTLPLGNFSLPSLWNLRQDSQTTNNCKERRTTHKLRSTKTQVESALLTWIQLPPTVPSTDWLSHWHLTFADKCPLRPSYPNLPPVLGLRVPAIWATPPLWNDLSFASATALKNPISVPSEQNREASLAPVSPSYSHSCIYYILSFPVVFR